MSGARTDRSAARCRHFGICGGCSLLDVPIAEQLRRKSAQVAALLADIGCDVPLEVSTPAVTPLHQRMKLSWPLQADPRSGLRLGMYQRGSHRLVAIDECRIQDPALTRLSKRVAAVLRDSGLPAYDEARHQGFLRAFHARLTPGTAELLLGLTTRAGRFDQGQALADALIDAARGLRDARGRPVRAVGVVRSIHEERGNALLGKQQVPLRGRDHQFDRVAGLVIRVGFGSFYQSHRDADALLFRPALAMLGDVGGQRVVDGYGGVGAFGLRVAARGAARVEVVESNPQALRDARDNATRNGFDTLQVIASPFATAPLEPAPDACIVDPPRAGLGPDGLARLIALRPARLLYASCRPASFAHDLAGLTAAGYRVEACRIVDSFPHTEHVELLAMMRRGSLAPA